MDAKGAAKMTRRYKGRPSAKTIARDFPFIVELAVPLGGYGKKLNLMHSFHEAASKWRTSDTDTKMIAISRCGVLPVEQSQKSLPLSSAAAYNAKIIASPGKKCGCPRCGPSGQSEPIPLMVHA